MSDKDVTSQTDCREVTSLPPYRAKQCRCASSSQDQHSTCRERAASGATGGAQPLAIVTTKPRRWQFDFVVVCNIIAVPVEYDTIAVLVTDMAC